MPYQREAREVLADWYAVQRALRAVRDGIGESDALMGEAAELRAEAIRLRNEYQRLTVDAIRHSRPEPPPFPTHVEP